MEMTVMKEVHTQGSLETGGTNALQGHTGTIRKWGEGGEGPRACTGALVGRNG